MTNSLGAAREPTRRFTATLFASIFLVGAFGAAAPSTLAYSSTMEAEFVTTWTARFDDASLMEEYLTGEWSFDDDYGRLLPGDAERLTSALVDAYSHHNETFAAMVAPPSAPREELVERREAIEASVHMIVWDKSAFQSRYLSEYLAEDEPDTSAPVSDPVAAARLAAIGVARRPTDLSDFGKPNERNGACDFQIDQPSRFTGLPVPTVAPPWPAAHDLTRTHIMPSDNNRAPTPLPAWTTDAVAAAAPVAPEGPGGGPTPDLDATFKAAATAEDDARAAPYGLLGPATPPAYGFVNDAAPHATRNLESPGIMNPALGAAREASFQAQDAFHGLPDRAPGGALDPAREAWRAVPFVDPGHTGAPDPRSPDFTGEARTVEEAQVTARRAGYDVAATSKLYNDLEPRAPYVYPFDAVQPNADGLDAQATLKYAEKEGRQWPYLIGGPELPPLYGQVEDSLPYVSSFDLPPPGVTHYRVCWQKAGAAGLSCSLAVLPVNTPQSVSVDGDAVPDVVVTMNYPADLADLTSASFSLLRADLLNGDGPEATAVFGVLGLPPVNGHAQYLVLGHDGRSGSLADSANVAVRVAGDGAIVEGQSDGSTPQAGYVAALLSGVGSGITWHGEGGLLARFDLAPVPSTFEAWYDPYEPAGPGSDGMVLSLAPSSGTNMTLDVSEEKPRGGVTEHTTRRFVVDPLPPTLVITQQTVGERTDVDYVAPTQSHYLSYAAERRPDRDAPETFDVPTRLAFHEVPARWNLTSLPDETHFTGDRAGGTVHFLRASVADAEAQDFIDLVVDGVPLEAHYRKQVDVLPYLNDAHVASVSVDTNQRVDRVQLYRALDRKHVMHFEERDAPKVAQVTWGTGPTTVTLSGPAGEMWYQLTSDGGFSELQGDHALYAQGFGYDRSSYRAHGLESFAYNTVLDGLHLEADLSYSGEILSVYHFKYDDEPGVDDRRKFTAACIGPLNGHVNALLTDKPWVQMDTSVGLKLYREQGLARKLDGGWPMGVNGDAPPLEDPPWLDGVAIRSLDGGTKRIKAQFEATPTLFFLDAAENHFEYAGLPPTSRLEFDTKKFEYWEVEVGNTLYGEVVEVGRTNVVVNDPPRDVVLTYETEGGEVHVTADLSHTTGIITAYVEKFTGFDGKRFSAEVRVSSLPGGVNVFDFEKRTPWRYSIVRETEPDQGVDPAIAKLVLNVGQGQEAPADAAFTLRQIPGDLVLNLGTFASPAVVNYNASADTLDVDAWVGERFLQIGEIDFVAEDLGDLTNVTKIGSTYEFDAPNGVAILDIGFSGQIPIPLDTHGDLGKAGLVQFWYSVDGAFVLDVTYRHIRLQDLRKLRVGAAFPSLRLYDNDVAMFRFATEPARLFGTGGSYRIGFWSWLTIFPIEIERDIKKVDWEFGNIGLSAWATNGWSKTSACIDWRPAYIKKGTNGITLFPRSQDADLIFVDPLSKINKFLEHTILRHQHGDWRWTC